MIDSGESFAEMLTHLWHILPFALMFSLPAENWFRLFVWMALGLIIYFVYGRKHSVMAQHTLKEVASHGSAGAYTSHAE